MNIEINRVHAHNKVNGCTKYEQDPLNITVCRTIMRAERTDIRMDRQTARGTTIPFGLKGPRVIIVHT